MSKTFNRFNRASGSTRHLIEFLSSPARIASREAHARAERRAKIEAGVMAERHGQR